MLLTVKDACELHPMTLEYSMSEQVENLSDVIAADTAAARAFFDKNYVTKGMETLLNQGLRRLGGKSDQAVFELKQAMGGGKTHSMIALGLLARNAALRAEIVPEMARDAAFGDAKLVAVEGRSGFEEKFVWGEITPRMRPIAGSGSSCCVARSVLSSWRGGVRRGGGAGNKQPQDVMLVLGLGAWFLVLQVHRWFVSLAMLLSLWRTVSGGTVMLSSGPTISASRN